MSEVHIVCQGATVYCDKSMTMNSPATAIPLTITSQILVEANGGKTVATDKDCTVANMNFGMCNDPKFTPPSPKPPCMAKVQWQKFYEGADVTPAGLKMLTEESEAICNICSVPGKIKIAFHGQMATITPEDMTECPPTVMAAINPIAQPGKDAPEPITLREI